jgi:hypothetical protein
MEPIPPEILLDDIPPELGRIGQRLRRLVRETLPDATERVRPGWGIIGYDVPVGRRTRFFAWILPQQEHIHLGFVHGVALDDPLDLLNGQPGVKYARWTTFEREGELDEEPLRALLEQSALVAGLPRDMRNVT